MTDELHGLPAAQRTAAFRSHTGEFAWPLQEAPDADGIDQPMLVISEMLPGVVAR